jgi:hypothetical protein
MTNLTPALPTGHFHGLLAAASGVGLRPFVTGEHAAYFWSRYFAPQEPAMKFLAPATGKSLVLLGDVSSLVALAQVLQAPFHRVRAGGPRPVLGVIPLTASNGSQLQVEFIQRLPGMTAQEVQRSAAELDSPELGVSLRLPSPFTCLKVECQEMIARVGDTAQDLNHLSTLVLSNRALLREGVKGADSETIAERKLVSAMEAIFQFTQSKPARHAAEKHKLDWLQLFPVVELMKTTRVRLRKFFQKRLQATFPSCPRVPA